MLGGARPRISLEIRDGPADVHDYVVVHERCHLHHFEHTDLFWNEVDKVLPEFRKRKEWLRKYGAVIDV